MLSFFILFLAVLGFTTPAAFAADAPAAACTGITDSAQRDRCLEKRLMALELRAADGAPRRSAAPAPTSIEFRWMVCQEGRDEVCRDEWGADTVSYMRHIESRYRCSEFKPRIDLDAALRGDPAQCRRGQPAPPAPAPKPVTSDDLPVDREAASTGVKLTAGVPVGFIAYADPAGDGMAFIPTVGAEIGLINMPRKGSWGWAAVGVGFIGGGATGGGEVSLAAIYGFEKISFGPKVGYVHWEEGVMDDYYVTRKGDGALIGAELGIVPGKHLSVRFGGGILPYGLSEAADKASGVGFKGGIVLGGVF